VTGRAAVIGLGGMGRRHLSAYRAAGVDIVAVADLDPAKAAVAAAEAPGARFFQTPEDLIRSEAPGLDIVSVVTNGPTHAAISLAAIEAGVRRVLCEKPVATNLADARRVVEAARRPGVRFAVNHIRRWSPAYARLKEDLDRGLLGKVRHIYFQSGSTGLGNFAVHAIDTMRFLIGRELECLSGFLDPTGTPNPRGARFHDPGGYGVLRFAGGARGFVDTSEDTGIQYLFVIAGEYGRVIVDELNNAWTFRARAPEDRALPFTRYGTPMPPLAWPVPEPFDIVDLTRRAIEHMLTEEPLVSTVEDGLRAMEAVIGFHLSNRSHAPVDFPLGPDHDREDVPIG
jgi:predicted dehydrogenase